MTGDASAARTPARPAAKPASSVSSSAKQRSIMSFFQKSSPGAGANSSPANGEKVSPEPNSSCLQETTKANFLPKAKPARKLSTPVPSSDALEPPSSQENIDSVTNAAVKAAKSSPTMAVEAKAKAKPRAAATAVAGSSPTRKVSYYTWRAAWIKVTDTK